MMEENKSDMNDRDMVCEYTWVSLERGWGFVGEECGEQQVWGQWWQQGSSHELYSAKQHTGLHLRHKYITGYTW